MNSNLYLVSNKPCPKGHLIRYKNGLDCVECKKLARKALFIRRRDPLTGHSFKYRYDNMIFKKYGITIEEYEKMRSDQNDLCKICDRPERRIDPRTGCPTRLAIDHCHETGKIRGLLCAGCNISLGIFQSFKERCEKYLGGV